MSTRFNKTSLSLIIAASLTLSACGGDKKETTAKQEAQPKATKYTAKDVDTFHKTLYKVFQNDTFSFG